MGGGGKKIVNKRCGDAIQVRRTDGDTDGESEEANKATKHPPISFVEMMYQREKFHEAVNRDLDQQRSAAWRDDPQMTPNVKESQQIRLGKRIACLVASYLLSQPAPGWQCYLQGWQ